MQKTINTNLWLKGIASFALLTIAFSFSVNATEKNTVDQYLDQWSKFYPTKALAEGKTPAALKYEEFSDQSVQDWVAYNRELLSKISARSASENVEQSVNNEVLIRQLQKELLVWEGDPLTTQPEWYSQQISQALTHLLVRNEIPAEQRQQALLVRLEGIQNLSRLGQKKLLTGNRFRTERAITSLTSTAEFFRDELPRISQGWSVSSDSDRNQIVAAAEKTADSLIKFSLYLQANVLPDASLSVSMGAEKYTRALSVRSGGHLQPEGLAENALKEINLVRQLMLDTARKWWLETQETAVPGEASLLAQAIDAMENDRDDNPVDFEQQFTQLTQQAEEFVMRKGIATVPQPTTLYIALSPSHFSGAAVGGVYPTGPYSPDANTLFYLPSIPANISDDRAEGFYRSFNHHFNTMIISHEMFPGHYLQYKVAVKNAPAIRSIFADGAYVEGWGSFSEKLMLDAGWGNNATLTWLAHYRKRLENATRAYISVMVHSANWNQEKVVNFSVGRGLLAPQFAINLWQRVAISPLQLTDYFVGYHQFSALWKSEKLKRGDDFDQRRLVDDVLSAGPVPVPALSTIIM